MKKSILLLSFVFFVSCSKQNCEEEIAKLNDQYKTALFNAGTSTSAIIKVNSDYQYRLGQLNERCD